MRRLLPTSVVLMVLACGEDPHGWYAAEASYLGYQIVRADPETGSCVHLTLTTGQPHPEVEFDDDLRIRGDDVNLVFAAVGESATSCSPRQEFGDAESFDPEIVARRVSGKITFRDLRDGPNSETERACRMHLDLRVELRDGTEVVFDKRDVPVLWADCPEPRNEDSPEWTQAHAATSADGSELVVAHFDDERELCAWYRFVLGGEAAEFGNVETPEDWFMTAHSVTSTTADACSAAALVDGWVGDVTATPSAVTGALQFTATQAATSDGGLEFEAPCELEVELASEFWSEYYWVPGTVTLRAEIPVAGICG